MPDGQAATTEQITLCRRRLGLTAYDPTACAGGYTLFARQTGGGVVDMIDIEGHTAHQWSLPVRPGRDAVILANGNLGYNGSHATSAGLYPAWDLWHGGDFYEVTPDGEIVWQHEDILRPRCLPTRPRVSQAVTLQKTVRTASCNPTLCGK